MHSCPVCGEYVFPERSSYDICTVCGWEDDESQERLSDMGGGANEMSLTEARRHWRETGKQVR